ncbi:NAD(P)/FAD-dependent oxidoreductase [Acidovorax sp. CCYZU-2555]|uniref:NAD(P)/FAD-dependent oxidoreductase n=1 Tax=Acidovorax sp. CCYZU-2555 TaxID=2835042 RepID=UPI001BCDF420|nr:NAD(P)/FAD-dependent oxidoreductase [Acidovorax sp. CCYZU-2555]MBS7778389.1 FAD-dependent oxidoreductase [Acidovorax sp. CCYZU-2555]
MTESTPPLSRRALLTGLGALAMPGVARAQHGSAHVVVVGGGFGGATAARHLRLQMPGLRITLIEPAARHYTCAFSSLYLAGLRDWESLGHGFEALRAMDIAVVHAAAVDVDAVARTITLSDGQRLVWDKLVLSPGVDMRWGELEGYDAQASMYAPHAWSAGAQTRLLRDQLHAMPDGGTFAMVIPATPYRCPPGPYERAALVAHYFRARKPKSRILLLDAKNEFSKKPLFLQGWKALYGDMIDWRSLDHDGQVVRVDARRREVETAAGALHRADVLNVIAPQKAGWIAERAGLTDASGWVPVHPENFAARQQAHVHVIGDASQAAPMPKSGASANSQGRLVAAAISAELLGQEAPQAVYTNTCYSLIGPEYGISVAGVYRAKNDTMEEVPAAVGISPLDAQPWFRAAEARYGTAWYQAISADTWGN